MGLVAASTPERRARALPAAAFMPQIAQPGVCAGIDERLDLGRRRVVAGVVDDDQLGEALAGTAAYVSWTRRPMLPASLSAGMTTVTRIKCPCPSGLAATPLDTP